jgi:hypothetical protein
MEVDGEAHPSTQLHARNQRKPSQISRTQNRAKILWKSQKKRATHLEMRFNHKDQLYWWKSNVYKVWKPPEYPPTLWKMGRISHILSTLLLHLKHTTPPKWLNLNQGVEEGWLKCLPLHQPLGSIYSENKRLECPCGPKRKLHLMKGNLVRLPLHLTRRHRTSHLLLYLHAISMMMPRVPPTVAHPLVLRQNWETLARLAIMWSKPLYLDECPTPSSSRQFCGATDKP